MIGVAFVNEIVFWTIGLLIGWKLGKRYERIRLWLSTKGWKK